MNETTNRADSGAGAESGLPLGVVTVTYSPGEHLRALVDSLPGATTAGTVLIMADNGSKDGAPEAEVDRAEEEGRTGGVNDAIFLPTGGNLGYGKAANIGIAELAKMRDAGRIRGDYVLLVNPDVIFDDGAIDAMLACAARNPRAGAIGPLIREADGSAYPSARAVPDLVGGIGHALLADIWPSNPFSRRYRDDADMSRERDAGWLSGSCLLLKWDAFDSIGGFDDRYFMYMEDVDLGDRLGRAGWRNIFCPGAVIRHAQGHSASSHPEITVRAHHDSAYRFMSDRLPGPWLAPVRWALKIGLSLRGTIILAVKKRRQKAELQASAEAG
ncbi:MULTISPECIES: glycosyltransferase family 2 protein [Corynebacterium]|uniref:glycosyltransferase family 2 protein n=1 Tax=Corynebacterium TaxID=1716 RepID=UPI0008A5AD93|nr:MULTISPECIES: glycosyltransferase family 2 protein [Corynebacterium]OFU57916.1 alpha-D-GlcNAc-diphosphoryl polyprenol, alpha-3-L-rhamnosyl transferase [Corynebacterium sp. HMSC11E11]UBI02839.1 glycosyltransferase family 2 protein [Corynebacterium freneyi]